MRTLKINVVVFIFVCLSVTVAAQVVTQKKNPQKPPAQAKPKMDHDRLEKAHEGLFSSQPNKAAAASRLTEQAGSALPRGTSSEAKKKFGETNVHVYRTDFAVNDRAQAEEETKGFAKIICSGRKNEIVGAHIVGPHAGELIHEVVLAVKKRLSITALGSMIHVYPTLTQINQQAGVDAILKGLAAYKSG